MTFLIDVKTPESYDEFLALCDILQKAGEVPVILDDRDQWPGFHYESVWLNAFAGPFRVKDAVATKTSWATPEFAEGMDKFVAFTHSKYVNEQINSLGQDDANALFMAGRGVMRVAGTWNVARFEEQMGDNVGFFYLPPGKTGIPSCPPGGTGEAVVINAKSKHPDETALFLDFMFNSQSVQIWYENGMIPSVKDVDYNRFKLSVLFKELVDEINDADTLGENIDVLMPPKVNDAAKNYIQELIAGRITGLQAMQQKQRALEDEIAAGNYTIE